ncbi:MAG: class I SAM-dependent methyltransferase [Nitrospina sp.]|jgi:2-polyprenyl-3-methyl-5-hydroxy-6-metoxy-1,4-benzoquinol methylase|nr:class I SAM-dependent methyltransferase [Nitrospina sp.]
MVLTGCDRLNILPGAYDVVQCADCGLMRTNPRPTPETMGFYYPDNYGPYKGTRVNPNLKDDGSLSFWRRWVKGIFRFNTTRLPGLQPSRVLEIGCASGAFLDKMSHKGWQVEGLEFSKTAAQSARSLGFSVHTGSLETAPDPKYLFDLVVGWMVLEHLHDPVSALQKLHRWVEPHGWLVLSVPNAGSLEFKIFRDRWYALHLPNHLYHYTPDSLSKICEAGGWKIVKIFHHRTLTNLIASTGYCLQDNGILPRLSDKLVALPESRRGLFNYFFYALASLLSIFGQTGRMTVWARKIDD